MSGSLLQQVSPIFLLQAMASPSESLHNSQHLLVSLSILHLFCCFSHSCQCVPSAILVGFFFNFSSLILPSPQAQLGPFSHHFPYILQQLPWLSDRSLLYPAVVSQLLLISQWFPPFIFSFFPTAKALQECPGSTLGFLSLHLLSFPSCSPKAFCCLFLSSLF